MERAKLLNSVENVYDDCEVVKLDCVGHVQKEDGKASYESQNPKERKT